MRILKLFIGFFFFAFIYYLPLYLDEQIVKIQEPRVSYLFESALQSTELITNIAINVTFNIVILFLFYIFSIFIGNHIKKITRLSRSTSLLLSFSLSLSFIHSINHTLFSLSNYSYIFSSLNNKTTLIISTSVILTLTIHAIIKNKKTCKATLLITIISILLTTLSSTDDINQVTDKNIIIIGIDSLSASAFKETKENLKNLNRLIQDSTLYPNAYTPIGRTFPAWISILSGKNPADHGAFFNLRSLDKIKKEDLLSLQLQKSGYETIFAIDERRFNNMDKSFGFDKVIGPKIGALDFVLQKFNDTPLTNLFLQTELSKHILPHSYINTASFANYNKVSFVNSIIDSISGDKNIFLSVHFESAHFPFKSRYSEKIHISENSFKNDHFNSLVTVDKQIGLLTTKLAKKGYLKNSLVIILSDHGEALGEIESKTTKNGKPIIIQSYGHGSSLLSEHQNRIVLGIIKFENGKVSKSLKQNQKQVSLLDIRKLIENYIKEGSHVIQTDQECLLVETGIRFSAAENYTSFNEADLARQSASYYEITKDGLLQIKEELMHNLVSRKDIGIRCKRNLTYYSYLDDSYYSYSLDKNGVPVKETAPSASKINIIKNYQKKIIQTITQK